MEKILHQIDFCQNYLIYRFEIREPDFLIWRLLPLDLERSKDSSMCRYNIGIISGSVFLD